MTKDEIRAMFLEGDRWKAKIAFVGGRLGTTAGTFKVTLNTYSVIQTESENPEIENLYMPPADRVIAAAPGYLHYRSAEGNLITLEKIP